jgi:hypothetical protein
VAWSISLLLLPLALIWLIRASKDDQRKGLVIFALLVACLALPFYFGFLQAVRYRTREWYYLALIAVTAGGLDLLVSLLRSFTPVRWARLSLSVVALVVLAWANWRPVLERQTNIDFVADKLTQEASARDLIVCNPWYLGISFNRYYHGAARWVTCPLMEDHHVHRFDLLKNKMMATAPIDDLLQEIRDTLRSNNRVWIVGYLAFPQNPQLPMNLLPAPNSEFGWSCDAYSDSWSEQLGALLQQRAANGGYVPLVNPWPVNELENVNLLVAQGWIGYGVP